MLKITRIKSEEVSDIEKYLFIEKAMRRGVSYNFKRHSETNDKYMKIMILKKKVNISCILTKTIYMAGE